MDSLKPVSKWLVVVGAINWGLVGFMDYNLVDSLLGSWPGVVRVVYLLVGAAGVWGAYAMATKSK
ncbi:MAG: hypothetical protein A2784_02895 [Candidatus Chisholmbacteria bacterium RIFCSPHIGHO2_01_FULL_48_12]|uniref:DUF378 domain-containing protein n=1 Tax=Candidatus Chisholmbacteria bacterium RIFCSPHIGHO2_01_FULL_48_12 TaxID=1797589 RepID=A0A1G1VRR0_9BACT|nr:MAG: hypothetical protein A2784_02895 [Candidatus Chisholmbacteria bacterium RIFCSPHIGHO2_01_FULL_48_12]